MVDGSLGRAENAGKQILKDLAKKEPYYKPTKDNKSSSKPKQIESQPVSLTSPVTAPIKNIKLDLKKPEDTEIVRHNPFPTIKTADNCSYLCIALSYRNIQQKISSN